ncbi:MAG: RagB/SusD family nutrient uptake outer membrane protein [Cytophagia bacterium]|nr:MAG: RagB/SusD family nutrient uptake outer membrane protein [Cytophagales bacterium]TAG37757.1 MAG: RagB/SusD family nutrient uptake outer membrane protein [Cytophagia bacterium]TAG70945.1 MAG: RagB/SusD family nutrient uptake outer membrane protein [Runella slithyformis]TAG78940.1 MAG: RagB/SusD family nutrient uptake outer membrane protein [Cytophagales bacterium]
MKNKTLLFAVAVVSLWTASGCSKFLDLTPISVANVNAFYKTGQDAVLAVNASYNNLLDLYRGEMWLLGEVMSDNTDDPDASIDNFSIDANNGSIESFWRRLYSGVSRCNTVLNRVPGIAMDEQLKQRLLLEARYLRAFYYFQLVQFYGDVPLVVNEVVSLDDNLVARTAAAKVYELIIQDLTAAEGLPVSYEGSNLGRATRGAAKMLLAKVYLVQRNWPQAAAKCKEVIDAGTYTLLPNYADVFTVASNNSRESVFDIQFSVGAQAGTGTFPGNNFFENFAPLGSASLVTGVNASNPGGRNTPTRNLIDAYEPNDPRLAASLATSYVRPGPPVQTITVNYILKTLDPTATAGGIGQGSREGWRALRYADLLLMYAEALNEVSGGNAEAFNAINQVRRRARGSAAATVLPDLAGLNQVDFRSAVARERRVELAFENHRWTDLVRTGQAQAVMSALKPTFQARNLLMPIPQRELIVNSLLSQNTGF